MSLPEGDLVAISTGPTERAPGRETFNVVFIRHDFEDRADRFEESRAEELALQIGNEIIARGPFDRHRADFRFWLWEPHHPVVLPRSQSSFCSGVGSIDSVDMAAERSAERLGLGNLIFMNLLNADCRAQGTWFDLRTDEISEGRLGELLSLPSLVDDLLALPDPNWIGDPSWLRERILDHIDFAALMGRIFRPFDSPRAYLPIPAEVVDGTRPLSARELGTSIHEFGHAFRLWDLYQEDLLSTTEHALGIARFFHSLNREIDLTTLPGLRETLQMVTDRFGISIEIPAVPLLEAIIQSEAVTRALGIPLGWPHCAWTPERGRRWAENLGIPNPETFFREGGCLYFGPDPAEGPNAFYRSSDSIMFGSGAEMAGFDAVESAWIEWQIECTLRPHLSDCYPRPWER